MSDFTTNDVGTKISDSSTVLPNSGGGHAVVKKDLKKRQFGSQNYWDKAYEYQFVTSFSVKSGTASGTVVANYDVRDLFSTWMKGLWTLNSFAFMDLEVQIVSSTNSGLTGTYVVGQCLPMITAPTIQSLADSDRILRQYATGDIFTERLTPVTNASVSKAPYEFSSIATADASWHQCYPRLVFINMSNVESTFANTALTSEFNIFCRFASSTCFTQVGEPITINGSNFNHDFQNPINLNLSAILPSGTKFVGDGTYGFNETRKNLDDVGVYAITEMFNSKEQGASDKSKVDITQAKVDVEFVNDLLRRYHVKVNGHIDSTKVGTLSVPGGSVNMSLDISDQVTCTLTDFEIGEKKKTLGESVTLNTYPIEVGSLVRKSRSIDGRIDRKINADMREWVHAKLLVDGVNEFESADVTMRNIECEWYDDGQISLEAHNQAVIAKTSAVVTALGLTTDNEFTEEYYQHGIAWLHVSEQHIVRGLFKVDDLLVTKTNGIVNLKEEDLVQLPADCVAIQATQRKIVPVVPATVKAQKLPTIIPELSLFDRLSEFYDPSRTFLLRVYESSFKQLVFDIIYSGPNKCCFVKQKNLTPFFVLDVTSTNLYIGSVQDLSANYTLPSSIISVPIVSRDSTASMSRLESNVKRFAGFSHIQFQGAAMSAMLGGGLTSLAPFLAEMASMDFSSSMDDKDKAWKKEMQDLIGVQKLEQIQQQVQEQLQASEQLNGQKAAIEAQKLALSNPSVQRSLAMSAVSDFVPDQPGISRLGAMYNHGSTSSTVADDIAPESVTPLVEPEVIAPVVSNLTGSAIPPPSSYTPSGSSGSTSIATGNKPLADSLASSAQSFASGELSPSAISLAKRINNPAVNAMFSKMMPKKSTAQSLGAGPSRPVMLPRGAPAKSGITFSRNYGAMKPKFVLGSESYV